MKVILYSTDCPLCRVLCKKLDTAGICYEKRCSVDEMISLGISHVPVLSVDGTFMDFHDANAWIEKNMEVCKVEHNA